MQFWLVKAEEPMVFDALPVVKTRYFYGDEDKAKLYTQARLYMYKQDLYISLAVFAQEFTKHSGVAFAFSGGTAGYGWVHLNDSEAGFSVCSKPQLPWQRQENVHHLQVQRFAGQDEQGRYTGAEMCVPHELLQQLPSDGNMFLGALFQYDMQAQAYGSSVQILDPNAPVDAQYFDNFDVLEL